jgi:uncharacterized tellurite resistance protein B-like protein
MEESIEYYATVLFIQAIAEDGKISPKEAKAVEEALGGFLEGLESEEEAEDLLNSVMEEISEDLDGYKESLTEAIQFFGGQDKELRKNFLELMGDLAGADGVSKAEKNFLDKLKTAWKV